MKKVLFGFLLTIIASPAFAKTVSGYVYDENNTPIEAATVFPQGANIEATTSNSTTTAPNGYFEIKNFPDNATLTVSYLGYESVTNNSPSEGMKITLKEGAETLTGTTAVACKNPNEKYDEKSDECRPTRCDSERYKLIGTWPDTKCEDQVGKECDPGITNAQKSKYEWRNNKLTCPLKDCINGYEVEKGKCVKISGNCSPMPAKAVVANRVYDEAQGKEICVIDSCKDGYHPSDDKQTCVEDPKPKLSEEDSKKQIEELQANADAMKEKEQSTANKLLGAVGMGATGIGGMMTASALAEQSADAAAERDMQAYLATFRCTYGSGQAKGGDKGVFLPGGNALLPLYTEYQQLASNLKAKKEALGMMPGIESEVVMDKSTMGLYDDESTGITNGTFTSLARAFLNPSGEDAAEWAAQQAKTSQNLKTGLITAGAGVAVGIIGDIAINHNAPKERSAEIKAAYELLKKMETEINSQPSNEAKVCPTGATGAHPNCNCGNKIYNTNTNTCDECTGGMIVQNNKCTCPSDKPLWDTIAKICVAQQSNTTVIVTTSSCDTTDPNMGADCTCKNGYQKTNDGQKCYCPESGYEVKNGICTKIQTTVEQKIELAASSTFKLNSSDLSDAAKRTIAQYVGQMNSQLQKDTEYKLIITGHTDKTGNDSINQPLSERRANAVKAELAANGIPTDKMEATGVGSKQCPSSGNQPECRKVVIELKAPDSSEITDVLGNVTGALAGQLVSGATK